MAVDLDGYGVEYQYSAAEKFVGKYTITYDADRVPTLSSVGTITIGASSTPSENTAAGTAGTVSGDSYFLTVLAAEWPATVTVGGTAYLGCILTLADGRLIPVRHQLIRVF